MGAKLREPPKKEIRQAPAQRLVERFNVQKEDEIWDILS